MMKRCASDRRKPLSCARRRISEPGAGVMKPGSVCIEKCRDSLLGARSHGVRWRKQLQQIEGGELRSWNPSAHTLASICLAFGNNFVPMQFGPTQDHPRDLFGAVLAERLQHPAS